MNWLDLAIVLVLINFIAIGYWQGFIRQTLDLIVLIISFVLAFRFYHILGKLISVKVSIAPSFANIAGFFIIWFVVELIYYIFFILFYDKLPEKLRSSKVNRWIGIIPAILRGVLVIWVLLNLVLILPITTATRNYITASAFAGPLVKNSSVVENYISDVFGGAINDTITFLTVKPESGETLNLGYKTTDVKIDVAAEKKMLDLVNQERTSRGLKPLEMDDNLQTIAREHSKDMFARGYFSHNTPAGLSPFDRMDQANIKYTVAGENLALAPDVDIAHNGLMNSPGHRANILTPEFRKVGIGIIDGGKYGEMFSQDFTD